MNACQTLLSPSASSYSKAKAACTNRTCQSLFLPAGLVSRALIARTPILGTCSPRLESKREVTIPSPSLEIRAVRVNAQRLSSRSSRLWAWTPGLTMAISGLITSSMRSTALSRLLLALNWWEGMPMAITSHITPRMIRRFASISMEQRPILGIRVRTGWFPLVFTKIGCLSWLSLPRLLPWRALSSRGPPTRICEMVGSVMMTLNASIASTRRVNTAIPCVDQTVSTVLA